jgi:hypothetical protein
MHNNFIGRKFKYNKTLFTGVDDYDRIVGRIVYHDNMLKYIISTTGVVYSIFDIEFEPLEIVRDQKLRDLGI